MSGNTRTEKTSPVLAFGYSLGEVGCQMSWYMINTYLMVFYTDIVHLGAGAISMIMLVARIWDAINDPMMGSIADRTNTRWGRFRPYLFMAPPILAIFNILTFTVWPITGAAKVIACLICYIGTGMAYTAVSIAYQALQNVIAIDSQTRMNLATARGVGSSIIGIILSAVVAPALLALSKDASSGAPDASGYFRFAIILSIAMIPVFIICGLICKEKYTDKLHGDKKESMGFLKAIKEVSKNDQLLLVVIATLLGTICVTGRMGLLVYYIKDVACVSMGEQRFAFIATFFTTMTIAQLIGNLLLPVMTDKLGKKKYMIILQLVMNVCFFLMFLFAHSGIQILLVISFIAGICNSAASLCFGMVADAIEYGDWKLGTRQEGVAASMLSFGVKLSTAICGSAGALLLGAIGYNANEFIQTAGVQTGINAVVNLVPMVIGLLSIVPLFWYKLTEKRVGEIRAELDAGKHAWDK